VSQAEVDGSKIDEHIHYSHRAVSNEYCSSNLMVVLKVVFEMVSKGGVQEPGTDGAKAAMELV
jgi:hypothetical protein